MELKNCNLCNISYKRKHIVNGNGDVNSDIMIIGDAPRYYEDKIGLPFVGASGQYLMKVLDESGFVQKNVFFTNVIRCKPIDNRKPSVNEIKNCSIHLKSDLINHPVKLIILLGRTAHESVFGVTDTPMSQLVNKVFITKRKTFIITTYHPSYVFNNAANLNDFYIKSFKKYYNIYVKYINPIYAITKTYE